MALEDRYPASYGAWATNPEGYKPDLTRCCEAIWTKERWSRQLQCGRKRGHGPDQAFCKQHDPSVVSARKAEMKKRADAAWLARRYEIHGKSFFETLKKIADGHNDARGLAQEAIRSFIPTRSPE